MATERSTAILETISKTTGFAELTADAKALDSAFSSVSLSSKELTKAEISLQGSIDRLDRSLDPAIRSLQEYERTQNLVARAEAQGIGSVEQRARILENAAARHQAAIGKTGQTVKDVGNTFGLAGHQVQNLTFQLNDLVTQIGSGGGILRPLFQQGMQTVQILGQGEGGLTGVLGKIGASLGRIGPIAIGALGSAGVAAGALTAAKAFADLRREVDATEKGVRLLTDSQGQANRVIAGAGEAAKGTELYAKDLYELRLQAENLANVDPTDFARGIAQVGASMGATREQMMPMIDAVGQLTNKLTITAGEAAKLARQFPELAGVLSRLFNTTPQGLLNLPPTLERSTAALNRLFEAVGKAPATGATVSNLSDSFSRLFVELDKASGASSLWNGLTSVVVSGSTAMIDSLANLIAKSEQARQALASIRAPSIGSIDAAGGIVPLPDSATQALPAAGGGGETASRRGAAPALDADYYGKRDAQGFLEQNWSDYLNRSGKYAEDTAASSRAIADNTDSGDAIARNTGDTARSIGKLASSSAFGHPGAFGDSIAAANAQAFGSLEQMNDPPIVGGMGKVGQGATGTGIQISLERMLDQRQYGMDPGPVYEQGIAEQALMLGKNFYEAAQLAQKGGQIFRDAMREGDDIREATKKADAALNELATAGQAAAESLDLGQLGAPIQSKIDALRSQQETALSRVYRPDPYAERNPDFFYSGERIFKESQDKVYDNLQTQITKLEGLQVTLSQLVSQGEAFPSAIVAAMTAAGFGDIAQQIVAAFRSVPGAPASATPAPTVVQTPSFSGGSAAGATPTVRAPGFNSLGLGVSVNR